jgi:hypothetical protein
MHTVAPEGFAMPTTVTNPLPSAPPADEAVSRLRREYGAGYAVAALLAVLGVAGGALLVMVAFGTAVGGALSGGRMGGAESLRAVGAGVATAAAGLLASSALRAMLDAAAASRAQLVRRALGGDDDPSRR